jgi:hypothetical protein
MDFWARLRILKSWFVSVILVDIIFADLLYLLNTWIIRFFKQCRLVGKMGHILKCNTLLNKFNLIYF